MNGKRKGDATMTNQQIAQLARENGYRADREGGGIVVWLITRKPSQIEIGRELDIPRGLIHHHPQGVVIYGSE